MTTTYTLYHASSMSSTYILALFELFSIHHTLKTIDLDFDHSGKIVFGTKKDEEMYEEMKNASVLAQFPTLVVEDGGERFVMTEMAAIAFCEFGFIRSPDRLIDRLTWILRCDVDLHDKHAAQTPWSTASLTPTQLGTYYRLMVFIPANIYPYITLVDFPGRFVNVPPSVSESESPGPTPVKEEVFGWAKQTGREGIKKMFGVLEGLLVQSEDTPYAVGTFQPTLADVYIALVAHYAPRPRHVEFYLLLLLYLYPEVNCEIYVPDRIG